MRLSSEMQTASQNHLAGCPLHFCTSIACSCVEMATPVSIPISHLVSHLISHLPTPVSHLRYLPSQVSSPVSHLRFCISFPSPNSGFPSQVSHLRFPHRSRFAPIRVQRSSARPLACLIAISSCVCIVVRAKRLLLCALPARLHP